MNNRVPLTISESAPVVPLSIQGDGAAVPVSVSADIAKDPYTGPYTVTPAEEGQTLETAGKTLAEDVTVHAVPSDYVGSEVPVRGAADVSISGQAVAVDAGYYPAQVAKTVPAAIWKSGSTINYGPAISLNAETGLVYVSTRDMTQIEPLSGSGYADASKKYGIQIMTSTERQLPTKAAETFSPSRQTQEIAAAQYLTGKQTILPIPDSYYDMSGPYSWMGLEADLFDPAFYTWNGTLDDTAFPDWTASTTATAMRASENLPVKAIDLDAYDYWIKWSIDFTAAFLAGATLKAIPTRQVLTLWQNLHRHPSNLVNAQSGTDNYNYCTSSFTGSNIIEYYNTSGTKTIAWGTSYGFYAALTAATFSSTSSTTPNLTRKTPVLNARCSSTYFATARAAEIDTAKSTWKVRGDMYRVKKTTSSVQRFYRTAIDLYNNPL